MRFLWKKNSNNAPANGKEYAVAVPSYACNVFAISETGPTRNSNEDSIYYTYPEAHPRTFFGIVADGMGGHEAGEVASRIACETTQQYVRRHFAEKNTSMMLEGCIQSAQAAILEAAEENSSYSGMGTTATMIYIRDGNMFFAHIGDSRLYHFRDNKLVQVTTDNTLVNEMVKEGKITEAEAITHDMKHVLTQALGSVREIHPEVPSNVFTIQQGDVFFLCSDGIYDVLQPAEIESLLRMNAPELAIEIIKALCTQRNASDNFSAILVEITTDQQLRIPVTKELNTMI
jgi:protein phosphatase